MSVLWVALGAGAGMVLGFVIAWAWRSAALSAARAELRVVRDGQAEVQRWTEARERQLEQTFRALAGQALQANAEEYLSRARDQLGHVLAQVRGDWATHREELKGLVQPLEKALGGLDAQVRALEQKREGAYKGLEEHLRQLGEAQRALQTTTVTLSQALKSSSVRGRWGELQLRRVVELSGMARHVDFAEQPTTDEGRPDMVVHLPGGGVLPIDAKSPMESYLKAAEADVEEERRRLLSESVRALRQRVLELGRKAYWAQFPRAPELVVMFVPSEAYLTSAFDADPDLLEFSMGQRVLIASPVNLLGLLRAVAFGWQQHEMAQQAVEVSEAALELYRRFAKFIEHLQRTGKGLDGAVEAFNQAVGSLEARVLPAARKLEDLAGRELPQLDQIDVRPRTPRDGDQ